MKTKLLSIIIGLFVIVVTLSTVLAISQVTETAATSRIIGDSLSDMKKQIKNNEPLVIQKAIYDAPLIKFENRSESILFEIFGQNFGDIPLLGSFDWFKEKLSQDGDKIIIFDESFGGDPTKKVGKFTLSEMDELNPEIKKDNDLFVLSSNRTGIYLPDQDSAVSELSPDSSVIATTLNPSPLFVDVFLCNLGRYETIGDTFMQTRNNYYLNTPGTIFYSELLGINMKSYILYGLSTKEISFPKYSSNSFCKKYQEYFEPSANVQYSLSEEAETQVKNFVFKVNDYSVVSQENYSILTSENVGNSFDVYELVLLRKAMKEEFPINTIITNLSVTGFSNPVDLTIDNLPMWSANGYIDRDCIDDASDAHVDFTYIYNDDVLEIYPIINPVEVINCTEGKIRLYQTISYRIEYVTNSPVLISEVISKEKTIPRENLTLSVEIENLKLSPVEGYLVVKDENNIIIDSIKIIADSGEYDVPFRAPETEGLHSYRVDFYYENESVTFSRFDFEVSSIDADLVVLEAKDNAKLTLNVVNNLDEEVESDIYYSLFNSNNIVDDDVISAVLEPGLNEFELSFNGLDRNKIVYNVFAGVSYGDKYKTTTATLIVEHSPTIVQPNIVISENETLDISPKVYDIDGDEVTISIDSPFENNSVIDFDSSGAYEVDITANDGIKQITKTIALTIENTNRPPVLDAMDKITGKEGESITFNPSYSDPDNENLVSNDDNNLTINSDGFINSTGEFELDYESSGSYTILVSVSDGEYYDTKELEVEIENTNRAPEITADSINVDENSVLNISEYVFDMDNNNSVSNDDNDLIVTCSDLFDSDGIWEIDYESAGVYDINVSVSDGEFEVSRIITINVANINRAPVLERLGREKYYIPENSELLLQVNAFDLDKDDIFNVSWYIGDEKVNEGNEYAFNANETIAEYNIDVVAADNYLSNETNFDVVVSDVPIFDGLDGETSQLNASELNSVYPFILEKVGKVKIIFQEPVNLEDTVDFVNTLILEDSYASLDSEFLEALRGIPAHVIFYNLDVEGNPIVYYNEEFGLDADTICPSSVCSNIRYVRSNNTLEFDISHFSTYAIQGKELSQFDLDADNITIEDPLKREIFTTFLIKNSGLGDLDNLAISGIFNPGFDLEVSPNMVSLPSQETAAITVFGAIMDIFSKDIVEAGTISFKDNDFERDIKLYIKPVAPVQISNLDIKVGDKSYNNLEDGDDINILPSKEMTILIEVENLYQIEMDSDVEVELSIDEFDFDETLRFDLNNDDKREKEVSLDIPAELSKDEYELEITLEADLENDMKSEAELVIELNYDEDNLVISRPEQLSSKELKPSKTLSIHGKPVFNIKLSDISPEFILVMFLLLNITLIAVILTWIARRN